MNKDDQLHLNPTVQFTKTLVSIPSITPVDAQHRHLSALTLDKIVEFFAESKPEVHRHTFSGDHNKWGYPVENLYLEWTFGKPEQHLCYMGHTDVVPVGDESKWTVDPFSGEIKEGWLYGRGATDMKGAIAAYCVSLKNFICQLDSESNLRLSLLITTDEEWAAVNGSDKTLRWMKEQNREPNAFVVGEPSSQDILGSHIKIGRRGSLCGTIVCRGVQGHAAYPELFVNSNRGLILAASILNTIEFNDAQPSFPASQFECIAMDSGSFAATAIVPGQAAILWNIRFTHAFTPIKLKEFLSATLKTNDAWVQNHPDASMLSDVELIANIDTASLPYYSKPGELADSAQRAIFDTLGLESQLDGAGGTTDGRFIHKYFPSSEIIELGLPEKGGMCSGHQAADYGERGGMHQVDERCSLEDLCRLEQIYTRLLVHFQC